MDQTIERIKEYLELINPNYKKIEKEEDLLDFIILEILDRVQLYLNSETIPQKLERILAKIVNTGLIKFSNENELYKQEGTNVEQVVTSISDNGQSISYANEVKKYFTTASDEELFSGFTSLLSRYRRIKVVHSQNDD
jgi:hypothetical protein